MYCLLFIYVVNVVTKTCSILSVVSIGVFMKNFIRKTLLPTYHMEDDLISDIIVFFFWLPAGVEINLGVIF